MDTEVVENLQSALEKVSIKDVPYASGQIRRIAAPYTSCKGDEWYLEEDAPFPPAPLGFTDETLRLIPTPSEPAVAALTGKAVTWGHPSREYTLAEWSSQLEQWEQAFPIILDQNKNSKWETATYRFSQTGNCDNIRQLFEALPSPTPPRFAGNALVCRLLENFKVDAYGNVICLPNNPKIPEGRASNNALCYFDVDHIFPFSRGGRSVMRNFAPVQCTANRAVKVDNLVQTLDPVEMCCGLMYPQLLAMVDHVLLEHGHERNSTARALDNILHWLTRSPKNGEPYSKFQKDVNRTSNGRLLLQYFEHGSGTLMPIQLAISTTPVVPVSAPDGATTFLVSGERFSLSQAAMRRSEDSYFGRVKSGNVSLSRDAECFRQIAMYLEDGTMHCPATGSERQRLLCEAQYFGLTDLTLALMPAHEVATLGAVYSRQKATEDGYRRAFVERRYDPDLSDPHLMLIDVEAARPDFIRLNVALGDCEQVFSSVASECPGPLEGCSVLVVANLATFLSFLGSRLNLSNPMSQALGALNWDHIFLAGGAVCGGIMADPVPDGFKSSDLDMFVYGLDDADSTRKAEEIYNTLAVFFPQSSHSLSRTKNAINIGLGGSMMQIITRLYKSPAEVLMSFDLDCVCVGFDGSKVWCLPRFQRALSGRINVVDPTHQSDNYEQRLQKYAYRGFSVATPCLHRDLLDPRLYCRSFHESCGLMRLLQLEALVETTRHPQGHIVTDIERADPDDIADSLQPRQAQQFHTDDKIRRILGRRLQLGLMYDGDLDELQRQLSDKAKKAEPRSYSRILLASCFEEIVYWKHDSSPGGIPRKLTWVTVLPQFELIGSIEAQHGDYLAGAYRGGLKAFELPGKQTST